MLELVSVALSNVPRFKQQLQTYSFVQIRNTQRLMIMMTMSTAATITITITMMIIIAIIINHTYSVDYYEIEHCC